MTVIPQPLYSTDRLRLTDSDAHVAGSPNRAGHSSQSQRYIFQIRDAVCIRPNLARSRPSLLYTTLSESPPRHTSPITSPFVIPSTHERLPHAARVTELATWRRGRHTPCGSRRARFLSHGDSRRDPSPTALCVRTYSTHATPHFLVPWHSHLLRVCLPLRSAPRHARIPYVHFPSCFHAPHRTRHRHTTRCTDD